MDIERIQKINNLALDLVKKGLASSQEEAIQQAEKIFKIRDDDVQISTRGEMVTPKETTSNESQEGTQQETQSEGDLNESTSEPVQESKNNELSKEKIEEILQKNTSFLVSKIKEFTQKIESLEREVAQLRIKVESQGMSQRRQSFGGQPPQNGANNSTNEAPSSSETTPSQNSGNNNGNGNHPRSGGYADTDVSIEKFFYAGNR